VLGLGLMREMLLRPMRQRERRMRERKRVRLGLMVEMLLRRIMREVLLRPILLPVPATCSARWRVLLQRVPAKAFGLLSGISHLKGLLTDPWRPASKTASASKSGSAPRGQAPSRPASNRASGPARTTTRPIN
jgi:hypothetical protein